ncbi:MAG: tetratricopeptide repeat protein [Acidobacteriota bacterium]
MRSKLVVCGLALVLALPVGGAVYEKYLSPDNASDRVILAYLDLADSGAATSDDLAELGVLLLNKGFPKDAERFLRRALEQDKTNTEARFRLGLVLQRLGEDRKAVRTYRRVVKERPGHTYAQFMLALALERTGNRKDAAYHYAKAYKHFPDLANPQVNPLVLGSRLQAEAQLLRYRREVASATIKVPPVDPKKLREMMAAFGEPETEAPPEASATPAQPAAPTPTPTPRVVGPGGVASPTPDEASGAQQGSAPPRTMPGGRPVSRGRQAPPSDVPAAGPAATGPGLGPAPGAVPTPAPSPDQLPIQPIPNVSASPR